MEIKINVYENDMKTVKKEVSAEVIDIPFGVVRKFMSMFQIKDFNDTSTVLNTIASSWEQITKLLDLIFPGMTDDDWNGVKIKELLTVVITVLKYSFSEMLNVPVDEKN
jgi:hypothetical protein